MIMKLLDKIQKNSIIKRRLKLQGKTNFIDSMNHALDGISYTKEHERNFKIELCFAVMVVIAGIFFKITKIEMIVLLLTIASVLSLELINTSIERCVDLVTKEYQELAKVAKDVAAGAVLIMSVFSIFIGVIIFLPKILLMLGVN